LKLYVNDTLVSSFESNESGEAIVNLVINNDDSDCKIQVSDISDQIKSKIKLVLLNDSEFNVAKKSKTLKKEKIKKEKLEKEKLEKEKIIADIKVSPSRFKDLDQKHSNDIEIIKPLIEWEGSFFKDV
jgi:hypothetical protein